MTDFSLFEQALTEYEKVYETNALNSIVSLILIDYYMNENSYIYAAFRIEQQVNQNRVKEKINCQLAI